MKPKAQNNSGSGSERLDAATQLYAELVVFCQQHGAPCFVGWPENILANYLMFHAVNRSLLYVRCPATREIIGLAVGWQCQTRNMGKHWQTHDPRGNAFYFSQLVCTRPGALRSLVRKFQEKFPSWRSLKLYANRVDKGMVKYRPLFFEVLAHGHSYFGQPKL